MNSMLSRALMIATTVLLTSCVILGCATNERSRKTSKPRFIMNVESVEQNPLFADYDREVASIVLQRWSDLLDTQPQNDLGKELGWWFLVFNFTAMALFLSSELFSRR